MQSLPSSSPPLRKSRPLRPRVYGFGPLAARAPTLPPAHRRRQGHERRRRTGGAQVSPVRRDRDETGSARSLWGRMVRLTRLVPEVGGQDGGGDASCSRPSPETPVNGEVVTVCEAAWRTLERN